MTRTSVRSDAQVSLPALWLGLFGAPLAWSIQELVSYSIVAHACYPSSEPKLMIAMPWLSIVGLIVSGVTLVLGGLTASVAHKSWKRSGGAAGGERGHLLDHGEGRIRFMALSGVVLSVLFLFSMVLNTVTLLLQPACS
jgi:hypothetical protein